MTPAPAARKRLAREKPRISNGGFFVGGADSDFDCPGVDDAWFDASEAGVTEDGADLGSFEQHVSRTRDGVAKIDAELRCNRSVAWNLDNG